MRPRAYLMSKYIDLRGQLTASENMMERGN